MKKKNYGKKLLAWVLALAVSMTLIPVMGQREVQAAKIMKKNKKQIENLIYRAKNALRKNLRRDGEHF